MTAGALPLPLYSMQNITASGGSTHEHSKTFASYELCLCSKAVHYTGQYPSRAEKGVIRGHLSSCSSSLLLAYDTVRKRKRV